jgi:hypothetical protein
MSNVFWKKSPALSHATLFVSTKIILLAYFRPKKKAKKKLVMTNEHATSQLNFWHQAVITGFN